MRAKVFLQEIWTAGIDWDHVLPAELRKKWEQWLSKLTQLSKVEVPGCLPKSAACEIQERNEASWPNVLLSIYTIPYVNVMT